jgi:hypothetical protein
MHSGARRHPQRILKLKALVTVGATKAGDAQ